MADFSLGLYFENSVTRADLAASISVLPEFKQEDSQNYWSGPVHLIFHNNGQQRVSAAIQERFGLTTAEFCLEVGVHSYKEEPARRMSEVLVELLSDHDVVGICDFHDVALVQLGGELTLDSGGAVFGDDDRTFLSQLLTCKLGPLGSL